MTCCVLLASSACGSLAGVPHALDVRAKDLTRAHFSLFWQESIIGRVLSAELMGRFLGGVCPGE